MVGRVYGPCPRARATGSEPVIRAKLPARSVAASSTEYVPGRLMAGTLNRSTPYGKVALVENAVRPSALTTIPTCEILDSRKRSDTGLPAVACPVSCVSAGGVVR